MLELQSSSILIFFMYGQGGHKLEINIPLQQIYVNSKSGCLIEGGVIISQYGILTVMCDVYVLAILQVTAQYADITETVLAI